MKILDAPGFLNIFQDVMLNDYMSFEDKEKTIKEELEDYKNSGYSEESIKWILEESFDISSEELRENKTPDAQFLNMCKKSIAEAYA